MSSRVLTPAEEVAAGAMEMSGKKKREGTPLHAAAEAAVAAEKPKKPRKRRSRVHMHYYVNLNRPIVTAPDEAIPHGRRTEKRDFSAADRRRLAREGKALVGADGHVSYPIENEADLHAAAHLAASGHGDVEAARRLIARRARELGVANPMNHDHVGKVAESLCGTGFDSPPADRRSEPLTYGHASTSAGDHGVGAGRARELAYRHPDLRQSNVSFDQVWSTLRTVRGNTVDLGVSDRTPGGFSHAGQVALRLFDAAGQAGTYSGRNPMDRDPYRPAAHPARGSATAPNGSHSTAVPGSCPPASAMKNSDRLAVMKEALFGGR